MSKTFEEWSKENLIYKHHFDYDSHQDAWNASEEIARKSERERVLDEVWQIIEANSVVNFKKGSYIRTEAYRRIKKLREGSK